MDQIIKKINKFSNPFSLHLFCISTTFKSAENSFTYSFAEAIHTDPGSKFNIFRVLRQDLLLRACVKTRRPYIYKKFNLPLVEMCYTFGLLMRIWAFAHVCLNAFGFDDSFIRISIPAIATVWLYFATDASSLPYRNNNNNHVIVVPYITMIVK